MKLVLRIINADELLAEQDRTRVWFEEGGSIGRIPGNDWVLPDPRSEISRVHARVYYENGLYYIEDLSTNGVFVGDLSHRVDRVPHAIADGDKLFIGHYQIQVDLTKEQAESVAPSNTVTDESADKLSHNLASLSFDEFPGERPESTGAGQQPAANRSSLIPENWLDDSIDNVVSDWSSSIDTPMLDPLENLLAIEPEKAGPENKNEPRQVETPSVEAELEVPGVRDLAASNEAISEHLIAQKAAFIKTIESVFASFDGDYIDYVMLDKGETRQDLTQRLFDEVFTKAYQETLSKSVKA